MKKPFKVGCVGAGMILNVAHIPAYVELRDKVILTAIFNPSKDRAQSAKDSYISKMQEAGAVVDWDVVICDTADELMSLVDIVDICTPSRYHAYYSALALEKNVHVMSEKPMSRNWLEANNVAEIAAKSKAVYQLNDDNVFLPRYQYIKNVINSGVIGDIHDVWLARGTYSSARSDWFYDPVLSGGGCILDYGSHAVQASWFLIGLDKIPQEVRSIRIGVKDRTRLINGRLRDISVDDDAHFKVRYKNPKNGDWINIVIETTWSWPDFAKDGSDAKGFIRVEGTEGTVTSHFDEDGQEYVKISTHTLGERLIPIKSYTTETLSFRDEILNLIRCIESSNESIMNAKICAQTIKVINAAQLSELNGRKSVNMAEVEEFCKKTAGGMDDMLEIGDKISAILNSPHKA